MPRIPTRLHCVCLPSVVPNPTCLLGVQPSSSANQTSEPSTTEDLEFHYSTSHFEHARTFNVQTISTCKQQKIHANNRRFNNMQFKRKPRKSETCNGFNIKSNMQLHTACKLHNAKSLKAIQHQRTLQQKTTQSNANRVQSMYRLLRLLGHPKPLVHASLGNKQASI